MKRSDRYKTSHLTEDQYEPGSRNRVLRNLLGIKSAREIDRIEAVALKQAEEALFAHAKHIPHLMESFEEGFLRKYTPCNSTAEDAVIEAMAEIHAEFVHLHPFREGNGRIARVLSTLMALQAGLPLLDFQSILGKKTAGYIAAIHAAVGKNYDPMKTIFRQILKDSARS